jgi:hypothetical protein
VRKIAVPIEAHAWAGDSASGPILDFTNPANAKKIYDIDGLVQVDDVGPTEPGVPVFHHRLN